jgi:hypothetical protein
MRKIIILFLLILLNSNAISQSKQPISKANKSRKQIQSKNDEEFLVFWNKFMKIVCVKNINKEQLKNISIDYLDCRETILSFDVFFKTKSNYLFDDLLKKVIKKNKDMNFVQDELYATQYEPFIKSKLTKKEYPVIQLTIVKYNYNNDGNPKLIILDFVKINKQYKLYGYDEIGG